MAEKKYIERDALLRDLEFAPDNWYKGGTITAFMDKQPAADVVEVVRCGQCKHWKINPNNIYGGYCRFCESAKMDHFCSYGERSKGG